MRRLSDFYRGRRVLVTGHTGFKGAWLCQVLKRLGAEVTGYALPPDGGEALFHLARVGEDMHAVTGDIRDLDALRRTFDDAAPEVVFHLAAQPIVREGYAAPVYTYETNVMGTVHVLECVRHCASVRSVVIVTTDKVYENDERAFGYVEGDRLDGFDPYSNSKSCAELVTGSYARSFFEDTPVAISTARAGNVIGGGDLAPHRILPDCVRAALAGKVMKIRHPDSVRPYQHVLEPLLFYLVLAARQYTDKRVAGAYNVGPFEADHLTTKELVVLFGRAWGDTFRYTVEKDAGPHEAGLLRLSCDKAARLLDWHPKTDLTKAVEWVVEWTKCYGTGGDIRAVMEKQIDCLLTEQYGKI